MKNKKQNSIEWLENEIDFILTTYSYNSQDFHLNKAFEQAKAMHKEEIVNTWTEATAPPHEIGLSDTTYILAQIKKAEQYYNETFEGNNE